MKDPYEILGVQKTDERRRRSAPPIASWPRRHHPDVNPGKPEAAERFKEISVAYDLLSDKDKRARFDRGEIDAAGNEVPPAAAILSRLRRCRRAREVPPGSGGSPRTIWRRSSPRLSAAGRRSRLGATAAVSMRGHECAVHADRRLPRCRQRHHTPRDAAGRAARWMCASPRACEDGHVLRLRARACPASAAARPAMRWSRSPSRRIRVFHREGDDIIIELPVTLQEAVLGTTLEVPTIKRPGAADHPARLRHRHPAAPARPRHPPRPPVRPVARRWCRRARSRNWPSS